MSAYDFCNQCAYEVEYNDVSARDFWGVSDEESAARDARIDAMGFVAEVERREDEQFVCHVCRGRYLNATLYKFESVE